MFEKKNDELLHDHNHDGIDRRGFHDSPGPVKVPAEQLRSDLGITAARTVVTEKFYLRS